MTLTIIKDLGVVKRRHRVICRCDCGTVFTVQMRSIKSGNTTSCGCAQRRAAGLVNFKHGLKTHPLYLVWKGMKVRCYNPKCRAFKTYGARGIEVCDEWLADPAAFVAWGMKNGWRPGLTINREDNDRGYEPSNCTFISKPENNRHRHAIARRLRVNDAVLAALSLAV